MAEPSFSNRQRMRIPFGLKIGLASAIISVGVATVSVYTYYTTAYRVAINQMATRLKTVGQTATFFFDAQAHDRIKRLTTETEQGMILSSEQIQQIKPGNYQLSLSPERSRQLEESADFQSLVQILRRVNEASRTQMQPIQATYAQTAFGTSATGSDPVLVATYLMVTIPQSPNRQVIKFIASSLYQEIPAYDWPGNPPGNLYSIGDPFFGRVFDGSPDQSPDIYTDVYGSYFTAVVPIKDESGKVIASLGLDYDTRAEDNQFRSLQQIGWSIIGLSLIISTLFSVLLARWLGRPIALLRDGANRLQSRDFTVSVDIQSNDELGLLAKTFNAMVAEIRSYADNLEEKIRQRTVDLDQANQEISLLNHRLEVENNRMGAELEVTRRLQQMILPKAEELQRIRSLDIAGFMQPATEVGGDYYDVLQENGQIKIGIGDVSGHGLESGMLMIMAQMGIRTLLASGQQQSSEYLNALNQALCGNVKRMNSDKNLTLALLDYHHHDHSESGCLTLTGQHEEMIVIRMNGTVERINTLDLGFPIGLEANIQAFVHTCEVTLDPGDVVLLYTDGLTEAENSAREHYGIPRLCEMGRIHRHGSATEIQHQVIADLKTFIGSHPIHDDITLLVLKQR